METSRSLSKLKNSPPYKKLMKLDLGIPRVSKNGVPHVVVGQYSIVYFGNTNKYRIFWPWPSFNTQERISFLTATQVVAFIKENS